MELKKRILGFYSSRASVHNNNLASGLYRTFFLELRRPSCLSGGRLVGRSVGGGRSVCHDYLKKAGKLNLQRFYRSTCFEWKTHCNLSATAEMQNAN